MKRLTLTASLCLTALLALPIHTQAAPVVVSWTNATQYVDGTPLGANFKGTRIEVGTCVGTAFGTKTGEIFINAPAATTTFTQGFGQWCFRGFTQTVSGIESASSNVAVKTLVEPAPKPPTGLGVL